MKLWPVSGWSLRISLSAILILLGLAGPSFSQISYRDRVIWSFTGHAEGRLPSGWRLRFDDGHQITAPWKTFDIDNSLWGYGDGTIWVEVRQEPGEPVPRSLHLVTTRSWGYGTYKARIRMQQCVGSNLAFWLNSTPVGGDPEIDIVEGYGRFSGQHRVSQGIFSDHYLANGGTQLHARTHPDVLNPQDWHVYECRYTPIGITLRVDGEDQLELTRYPGDADPVQIILSGAGALSQGTPGPDGIHARIEFDWVTIDLEGD